ncbi:hypothetical protein BC937DRAFT_87898 [Endogone sp. FLAS-F59071]|nr:hypothetical protein BC937DRAFT_87898 [Endogone sp. FLAS-F59071]|eukprot:RUS19168.1 hypothetical protein BC937DRAFT_87898 [Endogone sp. FLAS-F59071]
MRIITHNMLQCHVKDCNTNNFPLRFEDVEIEQIEAEYSPDFIRNVLGKIEWSALVETATQLGILTLPTTLPPNAAQNDGFLHSLHTFLLETHVQKGKMVCPNCGHEYPIKDGVPNMLLAEHEL